MDIKNVYDVIPYLDNFYDMSDCDLNKADRHLDKNGVAFKEHYFSADERLFKNPEKILSKMMVSRVLCDIELENALRKMEHLEPVKRWIVEWRIKPEYRAATMKTNFASIYARYSIYPKGDE